MPASDKYNAEPGFHFREGLELVAAMKAGFQTEHLTDATGLLTCAFAGLDSRPDGFGSDGTTAKGKIKGPKGEDLSALTTAQLSKLVKAHAPAEGFGAAGDAEAVPAWLAIAFTQMLVKAVAEYGPKLLDRLLRRK